MAEFLKHLTSDDRSRLDARSQHCRYAAGDTILAEGDRRHAIFALRSGRARVERSHAGYVVEIFRLEPGEIFGEMSFLEGEAASASVVADEACEVDLVEGDAVQSLIAADPGFYGRFYQSLAEILSGRLREANDAGIAEYAWGGRVLEEPAGESREGAEGGWGGGSPLRDVDAGPA